MAHYIKYFLDKKFPKAGIVLDSGLKSESAESVKFIEKLGLIDVKIAKEISFKMKTESTNDFCPEHFHLELVRTHRIFSRILNFLTK